MTSEIPEINLKELKKEKRKNFNERLKFIDILVEYIKTHDDKEWSEQQSEFINSVMEKREKFLKRQK